MTKLSEVPRESSADTPPQKFGDYFLLILKILIWFIVFCWWSTSNYLNSLYIDTDASYPVFGKTKVQEKGDMVERPKESMLRKKGLSRFENLGLTKPAEYMSEQYVDENVNNNPYATRWFNQGPINMSDQKEIQAKVNLKWWMERTQQSSYQLGGLILHYVFNAFKRLAQGIDPTSNADPSKADPSKADTGSSSLLVKLFSFLLWLMFGIVSNLLFASFLLLVFLMWIPGFLGGLTAFMPLAYYTVSPILQLGKKGLILFCTFVWMCIFGWVTVFPVIYEFFYLLYLLSFKQIMDNKGRFITELIKRLKQLVYIYVLVAVIIAFASKELPNETKYTIAGVCGAMLLYLFYTGYNMYKMHQTTKAYTPII
jgi:hypothetical protein